MCQPHYVDPVITENASYVAVVLYFCWISKTNDLKISKIETLFNELRLLPETSTFHLSIITFVRKLFTIFIINLLGWCLDMNCTTLASSSGVKVRKLIWMFCKLQYRFFTFNYFVLNSNTWNILSTHWFLTGNHADDRTRVSLLTGFEPAFLRPGVLRYISRPLLEKKTAHYLINLFFWCAFFLFLYIFQRRY